MATLNSKSFTIAEAMSKYLDMVTLARSKPTMLAYKTALQAFCTVLSQNWLPPEIAPIEELTEDLISPLVVYLKTYAPATEQLLTSCKRLLRVR